ncbi:MAG TPA: hypothetical protein VE933_02935 [Chitinophagaceae bacterium]|nr:hypothetical protein [Chitinophagaceae bacterium]
MNKKKHIFSTLAVVAFLFLAAGSAKVNKLSCGAFNHTSYGETGGESDYYVLLNDGTKVYGDRKIKWHSGLIVKDVIKVDDQKFAIKDTRGYYANGTYFGRYKHEYVKRIIHGKLNVYYSEYWVSETTKDASGFTHTSSHLSCTHYVQVGDMGELEAIASTKDIKEYVKDCPIAYEMLDKKDKQIRKAIRRNSNYMNEVFIAYNNNCK